MQTRIPVQQQYPTGFNKKRQDLENIFKNIDKHCKNFIIK